jgi:hypothetical protein
MRHQLKVCKDCNPAVVKRIKGLRTQTQQQQPKQEGDKPACGACPGAASAAASAAPAVRADKGLELAPGALLVVADGCVRIELQPSDSSGGAAAAAAGTETTAGAAPTCGPAAERLFRAASRVKDKAQQQGASAGPLRRGATPAQVDGLLRDCALLSAYLQFEGAYREQAAAHNALLLFVATAAELLDARLRYEERAVTAMVRRRPRCADLRCWLGGGGATVVGACKRCDSPAHGRTRVW